MTGVVEDIHVIPFKRVLKKNDQFKKTGLSFYLSKQVKSENKEENLPGKKELFPVDEWVMPIQSQGYIKARDNDCL